jgi:aminopeptidase N
VRRPLPWRRAGGRAAASRHGHAVTLHADLHADLAAATFTGEEEIVVRVARPTQTVVLNALDLEIAEASVTQGPTILRASVAYDTSKQQATLSLERPLAAGEAHINAKFRGTLNDQLAGFYLNKTQKRWYAAT